MADRKLITRRSLLLNSALTGSALIAGSAFPGRGFAQSAATGIITSDSQRPTLPYGVQTGDLRGDRAILWARANKPARMMVELSTTESFSNRWQLRSPAALEATDYATKIDLSGLPLGRRSITASSWST